ncbi:MAG: nodulation protein NfeD [Acidobacteria bacterium]|nr:nodulation protein NfeD [Acidobacteriota bacterium]
MRRPALLAAALLAGALSTIAPGRAVSSTGVATAAGARVLLVRIEGVVDPLVARYVERAVGEAGRAGDAALLVQIDTPGGLDSSMRAIIRAILGSPVPVVCWVGPSGARAASAGAFILVGCPVAAMAPGTNVGAAHPVGFSGEVLGEKITNDAAAYIRSLAERWGRNADWAERAVRESVSIPAGQALALHVADLLAPTREALLRAVGGREVPVGDGGSVVLRTAGATVREFPMTFVESLLHGVVDPNLAFLLFVIGLLGIAFEVTHPGLSVGGVVGVLSLLTSLVILGMLPVNLAGVLLILASIVFFVVDLKVPGHGLATAAGIVSLVLGGLFLFDRSVPSAQVSKGLVIGVAAAAALFFSVVVRAVVRARRRPPGRGIEAMVGEEGIVERALDLSGVVRARGESWSAVAPRGSIPAGVAVRVTGVRGLTLEVEPAEEEGER